jgi:hypothetical protein
MPKIMRMIGVAALSVASVWAIAPAHACTVSVLPTITNCYLVRIDGALPTLYFNCNLGGGPRISATGTDNAIIYSLPKGSVQGGFCGSTGGGCVKKVEAQCTGP